MKAVMAAPGRQFVALITAIGVVMVSVTCTSGGCILQAEGPSATMHAGCCSTGTLYSSSSDRSSGDQRSQGCPLCRVSILIGKSVEHNAAKTLHLALSPQFWASAVAHVEALMSSRHMGVEEGAPCLGPPATLFALHCALQT